MIPAWPGPTPNTHNDGSVERAADYLEVQVGLVEAAVACYGEYRDEVDAEIDLNEVEYERGRTAAAVGQRALRGECCSTSSTHRRLPHCFATRATTS